MARSQSQAQANQLAYARLQATVSGVVTALEAEVGQVLAAGQPVMRLAHDGPRDAVRPGGQDGVALGEREQGLTEKVVGRQLKAVVSALGDKLAQIVIAYEPVWAIGTGKTATPEDAQEVCAAIRKSMSDIGTDEIAAKCRILYGGSVKSSNVVEIMKQADVDGALVGGASLDPEEFAKIAKFHAVQSA